jgi:hypothetical protein
VKTRSRRHQRLGHRHLSRIVLSIFSLCILLASALGIYGFLTAPRHDFGVVEADDPITVRWWINDEKRFVTILLRPDAHSDKVSAYSHYTLKGIWDFGLQQGNNPRELNKVLTRTLSLPLGWYRTSVQGRTVGNMPWPSRVFYEWQLRFSDRKAWETFDFTGTAWYRKERLADGTGVLVADADAMQKRMGPAFEIGPVRRENLRVSVINTTSRSGLADDFAKILGNIGMYVGLVSNNQPSVKSCLLRAETAQLNSATAKALEVYFGCGTDMKRPDGPFDMEIFIGEKVFPYD